MRIAVCDDEKVFRDEITNQLNSYFGKLDLDVDAFQDGCELIDSYESDVEYDAIFLDVEMKELDGLATAKKLRELDVKVPIIFLTSHTELAMEGYEVYAFRFLAKPVVEEKMVRTLSDLKAELFVKKRIMIKCEGEDIPVFVDHILYVEARNNSICITLENESYEVRKKLGEMEKELDALTDTFVKIHRGYIVNLSKVKKHHGNEVWMSNGVSLPIGRTAVNEFKKRLFEYVKNQAR